MKNKHGSQQCGSEVLNWIARVYSCDLATAQRIFEIGSHPKVRAIIYDPATQKWRGNPDPDWQAKADFSGFGAADNILLSG